MTELGRKYRDKHSGFKGTAVSKHEYLYGCTRITLERLNEKGDALVQLTFDEPALEEVEPVRTGLDEAKAFLFLELEGGPQSMRSIFQLAHDAGISRSALQRAKDELGIVSRQSDGHWIWEPAPARTGGPHDPTSEIDEH